MISAEHFYEVVWRRYLKKYNIDALTYLPYGSSKFSDLQCVHSNNATNMPLGNCLFNDQEPLNRYEWTKLTKYIDNKQYSVWQNRALYMFEHFVDLLPELVFASLSSKVILAHSELYSKDLEFITQNCDVIPVYYWWHGLVARHWFNAYRFDPESKYTVCDGQQRFLLYSRAFTGTREYRLKLLDQIVKRNIYPHVKLNFHSTDGELHYTNHKYSNKKFTCYSKLEDYFTEGEKWEATASASINVNDFRSTRISVVAETVFENKVWFSEKICKAIAAGHPFVLLCGTHSLEVLRGYGFKTFSDFWDESYDLIEDGYERLIAVSKLLEQLAKMPQDEFDDMCNRMKEVVDYNQQWFYSKEFENVLLEEMDRNFAVVKDVEPGVLGGDGILLPFLRHKVNPEYTDHAKILIKSNLAYLKNTYPKIYETVICTYKDIVTFLQDSTETSEEQ